MSALAERAKQDVDNPTLMIHRVRHNGDLVALCGAKLRGIDYGQAPEDCHVCHALDKWRP